MKGLKLVAVIAGTLVALLCALLILAFTPGVQTWAVRKAVADQPGLSVQLERIAAGLSSAEIKDVRIVKDGAIITAKSITARYSVWDFLTNDRLNIEDATATDLMVDLRNATAMAKPADAKAASSSPANRPAPGTKSPSTPAPQSKPAAASSGPFQGILREAQLPMEVRVAKFSFQGQALLPGEQAVKFVLKGGGIETGQRGNIEWTVDFTDPKTNAPLRGLRAAGSAALHIAADRRIDWVDLQTTATAESAKMPAQTVKLEFKAEQPTPTSNESYNIKVALVRQQQTEPLLTTKAEFQPATHQLAGTWEIAVRSEQLAALLTGLGLPEVNANGSGKFTFAPDTSAASGSGELQLKVAQLEKISPELAAIGAIQVRALFDGGFANNVVRLDRLELDTSTTAGKKLVQISAAQKISFNVTDQRVTIPDPKAELARISLSQLPLAWAQPAAKPLVIERGDLSMVLAVESDSDGSHIRVRAIEPLTLRDVTVRSGDKKLVDQLTLSLRPQIEYTANQVMAEVTELKLSMPTGDSVVGQLKADVTQLKTTPAIVFTTQLQAKIVSLLKPYSPVEVGPLSADIALAGRLEGDNLALAKATLNVNREGNVMMTALELLQPLKVDVKKTTFAASNPNATVARLRLGELPLAWAEAFVPKSKFAGSLAGATLEISARSVEDLTVTSTAPVTLRGISVTMDGKPLAEKLDLTADFTATKRADVVTYDLRRLELKQGETALARVTATGEAKLGPKLTLKAKGNLAVDAATAMRQPAALAYATLAKGKVTVAFEADMAEATQVKATISARNLVAKVDNRSLGDLDVTVSAQLKADGSGSVTMPLTLTNAGRKSDLAIEGTFGKAANKETFLFSGKVASNQLVVDDFQPLAGLAPASAPEAKPTAPAPTRDEKPFWKGVNGKVEVDLKRVLYGKDYAITAIQGTATITDSRLSLDRLEGKFKENPFKVAAGVNFTAQQAKPYTLTGNVDVTNVDIGAILRAANPNEPPAMETKVTVAAILNGNGATTTDLAKNVYGVFDVNGTAGVLRALSRKGTTGQVVNLASSALAILGAARGSDTTSAIAGLASTFNEMPFDKFTMRVERGADLNLKVSTLEFISPLMRTTATGGITNTGPADTPIQNQPMQLQFQLGAKDQLALLLNKAGALGEKQDEKGYYLMTQTFKVGGTAAKPDSSSLWKILGEAAARAAAGAFLR